MSPPAVVGPKVGELKKSWKAELAELVLASAALEASYNAQVKANLFELLDCKLYVAGGLDNLVGTLQEL